MEKKGKAPLVPKGWDAFWSEEDQAWYSFSQQLDYMLTLARYYGNVYTKETTWEVPTTPGKPPVPKGWKAHWNDEQRKWYDLPHIHNL